MRIIWCKTLDPSIVSGTGGRAARALSGVGVAVEADIDIPRCYFHISGRLGVRCGGPFGSWSRPQVVGFRALCRTIIGKVHMKRDRQQVPASTGGSPVPPPPPDLPEWLNEVRLTVESERPLMQVFMMRAIKAVLRFTELSEDSIIDAARSPRDLDVLVKGLLANPIVEDLKAVEPLTPAFIRGYEAKRKLIEEHGGTLSAEKAGEVLGITRQAVEKRRQIGKLLALTIGRHGYRYPVWQFNESGTLPGLEQVLGVLASHDQWMQTTFFVSKNPRLNNRTPKEMLEAGEIDRVLKAASVYGEHGAA
jgi:hypothetical protein